MTAAGGLELFELELLGGAMERRYRRARPDIERLPWGSLDTRPFAAGTVAAARRAWTLAAFQEHRTAVACAATLKALVEARAPLDLVALAARFPLDEVAHVELSARMAMELGGADSLAYDPAHLVVEARSDCDALTRAADLVVRFFCVGEAYSIPLLRGAWRAARHPLPRAVLGRIVRDEAAHGHFGWAFLDWALPHLGHGERALLARAAAETIGKVRGGWAEIRTRPVAEDSAVHALGWLQSEAYLALAARSLAREVVAPLARRGLTAAAAGAEAASSLVAGPASPGLS